MVIMHSLAKKKKRFSLLLLEEGEIYTRDCTGLRVHLPLFPEKHQEKGRVHICSRSLIFEPEDTETPIIRYAYRDMEGAPLEKLKPQSIYSETENASRLMFTITRITELPDTKRPCPYKTSKLDKAHTVLFDFMYDNVSSVVQWVGELFAKGASHAAGFDQDNIVMQQDRSIRFDMSRIENTTERPMVQAPLLTRRIQSFMTIPGLLYLTDARLYFQSIYRISANPVKSIRVVEIQKLYKRRHRLRSLGFELFYSNGKSIFLAFYTERERDNVFNLILTLVGPDCETENSVENMTLKWQLGQISNYEYLMYLNSSAYRTFSDFTQYPVFPWVISNYHSSELDLNDPSNYRDLSKPIGALNDPRLENFRRRYKDMPDPKFLYGTHYSAPGYIIGFLFRKHPLLMIRLHGGKFDAPDRLFNDIGSQWRSVNENPTDVKELIPEMFSDDPSFLINELGLDFGTKQNGERVWDVNLPPWARNQKDFLKKMREALESRYVSENLHHWIDLIFGYKQKGEAAVAADNLFHPITYEGYVDLDAISDPVQRRAMEMQINEFGQTPKQLFKIPHPPRSPTQEETKAQPRPKSLTFSWNIESVARKAPGEVSEISLHKTRVSSILLFEDKVVTTGHDGCIKVFALEKQLKRTFSVCNLALTCSSAMNEKQIVAGSYDNKLYMFNLDNGRTTANIKAHEDAITCCEYIETMNAVCSGSWDSHIKVWDVRSSKPVHIFDDHEEQIVAMSIDPSKADPYKLITGDLDGCVIVRDLRQGVLSTFQGDGQVSALQFTTHSNHIVASFPNEVGVYEENGNFIHALNVDCVSSLKSDGIFVLSGKEEGELELWELMKGDCLFRWQDINRVTALAVHPSAEIFVAGSMDGNIYYIR